MESEKLEGYHKLNFGVHENKSLEDIPDSWYTWISSQKWFINSTSTYNTQLKEYIKTNRNPKAISMNLYPKKTGWSIIFDKWHNSHSDDLQEWLENNYQVPLEK